MDTEDFKLKSYGWQEIALLYNPDVSPMNAVKRLSSWVARNPRLEKDLKDAGWSKGARFLTPLQVKALILHLGEP